jgi:hypothetical protein
MNAEQIVEALRRHHAPSKGWVSVVEVRIATGWKAPHVDGQILNAEQRIDFFALHTWPSKRYERIAYEIKVGRADLLRELREPGKRRCAELLANRFVFACPAGLMGRSELPAGCGLVEVQPNGSLYTFRQGEWRDRPEPPLAFVASLMRSASGQRANDPCGAASCHRPARHWMYSAPKGVGVQVPLCDTHMCVWQAGRPENIQARRELEELARINQERSA